MKFLKNTTHYHPLAHQGSAVDVGYYDPTYDLTASLVIGNQVIPSQEIQGVREAYVHLMHCADNPLLVRSEAYKHTSIYVRI